MINARMKTREAAPVWAVLGAPLLGIPLLVALLALAAPNAGAPEGEAGTVVTIERLDGTSVEPAASCPSGDVSMRVRKG